MSGFSKVETSAFGGLVMARLARALPARGGLLRSEMLRACLPAVAGAEDAG
jgi:hypothetical protein